MTSVSPAASTPETLPEALGPDEASGYLAQLRGSSAFWIGIVVIALIIVFGLITPNNAFIKPSNLLNIGLNASQIMLIAVGMTFLIGAGYLDLSVGENLGYFARVLGTPADRVDEVVRTVGLAEESGRVVGSLSGGQRARVSLATALLTAPANVDEVARAIALLATDRQLAATLAQNAHARLVERHTIEQMGNDYLRTYTLHPSIAT